MDKMKATKKILKRRKPGKENAEPESQNNSLWENLLGDINEFAGRRSDVGKRSLMLEHDESITDVDINNDEQEKEDLRREKEKERLAREKEASAKAQNLGLLNNLTQSELDQHYSKCIEMCNKNKVNVKNAFKLQLIDYMKLIVSNQSTKSENLTLMSCTLGASAKIYAHRVDKVYTDMVKIVSGKEGEIEIEKEENSDDEKNNENENDDDETVQKHSKKKRTTDGSDGENEDEDIDMEKMLLSEAQLNKGKGEVEEGSEKTNLPRDLEYFMECPQLDPDGRVHLNPPLFVITPLDTPSNTPFVSIDEPPYSDSFVTLDPCEYIKDYKDIRKCFSVLGEGEESEDKSAMFNSSLAFDPSSNIDLPDAIRIVTEERDMFCEDGVAPDTWTPDYDEEYDSDKEIPLERKSGQVSVGQPKAFDTKAMARLVSADAGDYSFFNNRIDFWAGPSHWTIKRAKVGEKVQKPTNETQKKTFKKTNVIEFSEDKVFELKKLYSGEEDATLTRRTIINWSGRKWKIPREVSYTQKKLLSLMKNEHLLYVKKDSSTNMISSSHLNGEEEPLLSPDDFGGDMGHEDDYDEDDNRHMDDKASLSFFGERPPSPPIHMEDDQPTDCELVPAPQRVTRVNLKFAKAQKKIDIKLLKSVIWKNLSLEEKNGKLVKFSDIFSSLPVKLPPEEAAELSFPIAFMALLHLANEKTLKLQGTSEYSDVQVALG